MLQSPKDDHVNMKLPEIRCKQCGKLLGFIKGKYEVKCSRCKTVNTKVWADNLSDEGFSNLFAAIFMQGFKEDCKKVADKARSEIRHLVGNNDEEVDAMVSTYLLKNEASIKRAVFIILKNEMDNYPFGKSEERNKALVRIAKAFAQRYCDKISVKAQ